MILAGEFEELERERKAVAQKNKFPRTKSAAPTQAMCRRCEDTGDHEPRRNEGHRAQSTNASNNGQWTTTQRDHRAQQQNQQRQPTNTLWRPPSTTQRPHKTTHIIDIQEAVECAARECRHQCLLFCWVCGRVDVRSVECCQQTGNVR